MRGGESAVGVGKAAAARRAKLLKKASRFFVESFTGGVGLTGCRDDGSASLAISSSALKSLVRNAVWVGGSATVSRMRLCGESDVTLCPKVLTWVLVVVAADLDKVDAAHLGKPFHVEEGVFLCQSSMYIVCGVELDTDDKVFRQPPPDLYDDLFDNTKAVPRRASVLVGPLVRPWAQEGRQHIALQG